LCCGHYAANVIHKKISVEKSSATREQRKNVANAVRGWCEARGGRRLLAERRINKTLMGPLTDKYNSVLFTDVRSTDAAFHRTGQSSK